MSNKKFSLNEFQKIIEQEVEALLEQPTKGTVNLKKAVPRPKSSSSDTVPDLSTTLGGDEPRQKTTPIDTDDERLKDKMRGNMAVHLRPLVFMDRIFDRYNIEDLTKELENIKSVLVRNKHTIFYKEIMKMSDEDLQKGLQILSLPKQIKSYEDMVERLRARFHELTESEEIDAEQIKEFLEHFDSKKQQ